MTDDQTRRPDPELNDEDTADKLDATEEELEEAEPEAPAAGPAPAQPAGRARPARASTPARDVGYRGSLPPRDDRLARPWILSVIGLFVLILVLSLAGLPSRLFPEPTPAPIPSFSLEPLPSSTVPASPQ